MTDSFGARLRRERELKHIALDSISGATKIKRSLFEDLERDDLSRWPSGIFRRSFIKAYAEAVGLPVDPLVKEFDECFPDPAELSRLAAAGQTGANGDPASGAKAGAANGDKPHAGDGMRLTLAENPQLMRSGWALDTPLGTRFAALAWDACALLVFAAICFVIFDRFWMPLALATMTYYMTGFAVVGVSPGLWLLARTQDFGGDAPDEEGGSARNRARGKDRRGRPIEPPPINPFKTVRRTRATRT